MNIRCHSCGHEHALPDNAAENRRIYFFCQKCGHKVVIDGRKSFAVGNAGPSTLREVKALPSMTNLLEVIPNFFNPTVLLMSFWYGMGALLVTALFALVLRHNLDFFLTHLPVLGLVCVFLGSVLIYGYNLLLYFISKINFFVNDHPNQKIDWGFVLFDIREDFVALFIISVCLPLGVGLLVIPAALLKEYSLLYAAIVYPVIFFGVFLVVLSFILQGFLPAIIASESRYVGAMLVRILNFLKREVLTIPFYIVLIEIILAFVNLLVFGIFFVIVGLSSAGVLSSIAPSLGSSFSKGMSIHSLTVSLGSFVSSVPGHMTAGIIIFTICFLFLALSLWSVCITIRQTLYAQATAIMKSNPAKSIRTSVMIGTFVGITALIFLGLISSFFFKLLSLAKLS